jgi:DNA repair photolyase
MDEEERARLPGYSAAAVVRHFEAPDAVKTRFYEIEAKSILNRVPAASRMPFRWTINPYRGCSHGCSYCVVGETPVLMADGSHRRIDEIDVGDAIYGTVLEGQYRRYTCTTVLDKWRSVKAAYRVTLEDGTELITSGDHRFLSDRGWKHVVNTPPPERDRAHLTTNNHLVGTGAFAPQPVETVDYRTGYVCGIVRGDARREMTSIGTGRAILVDRIRDVVQWPVFPSLDWCRGFLAGIFDAEGCRSDSALRIANTDPEILAWSESCLARLGFAVAHDRTRRNENGLTYIRIRGGLSEHMRFFHLTDPAITGKRSIEGQMVKTFANLKVAEIEPLGRAMRMYDITTGTGDFIANGVVSHNCFARPTHTYLDFNADEDFEREIVVKVNAPERLRVELARPSWKGEHVALGTNTDPYQWVEGRYKLMRPIWEAFRDARNPCSILTKSPLLLRDLDVMKEIAARTSFSAALSVPTLDEKAWRATEPHTPHPRARLEAVAELTRAGIPTGVLVAPLMPGINDMPEQVEKILELATEAGASHITGIALHLRGEVRDVFFDWLKAQRPDLVPRYAELYKRGAYAPLEERRRLASLIEGADRLPGTRAEVARWRGRSESSPLGEPTSVAPPDQERPAPDQQRLF